MGLRAILMVEDIDDDAVLATRVVHYFHPAASVIVCSTGEGALKYLSENKMPDMILLDLGLPNMDGLVFLRHMRSVNGCNSIPVVILTGAARDVADAYPYDVQGYLLKPLTREDLKSILHNLRLDI